MNVVAEILYQVLVEIVCYGTGRAVAAVITPHILVEEVPPRKEPPVKPWSWRATYQRDGRRYYYAHTIGLLGLLSWIVAAILIAGGVWLHGRT